MVLAGLGLIASFASPFAGFLLDGKARIVYGSRILPDWQGRVFRATLNDWRNAPRGGVKTGVARLPVDRGYFLSFLAPYSAGLSAAKVRAC